MTERSAALGAGTLASVVTALPALPRVIEQGASATLGLLFLIGGTALVLGPALLLVGAIRAERPGVRATLLGLALAGAPLSILGEGLKQGTHHRPLGAATFAVLALVTITLAIAAAFRLLRFSESGSSATRRFVFAGTVVVALASVGFVFVRALGSSASVPHVLDALRAFATAALFHLLLRFPRVTTALRRFGAPLWVAVVVAGLVAGRGTALAAVRAGAPVLGGPLAWI